MLHALIIFRCLNVHWKIEVIVTKAQDSVTERDRGSYFTLLHTSCMASQANVLI